MSQFSLVPVEIFYSIIGLLGPSDLSRFSRTCQQIHQLATPRLWRSYRKYNQESYNSFLRTILINPDLASHIEELCAADATQEDPHEISEGDIQLFQSAASNLSFPAEFKDRLKSEIREGYSDPPLVIILCIIPNLRNLFLNGPERCELMCELFDSADSCEFSGLYNNIQRFSIETENYLFSLGDCHEFVSAFNMMHELQIVHLSGDSMSPRLQNNSSAVEHLHILESCMGPDVMQTFIRGCKKLRTFNYTFGGVRDNEEYFRPQDAVKELERHIDTLEELTMLYYDDNVKMVLFDLTTREWYMGTELRQFTKLRKLRCGMHSLLGLLHFQSTVMEVYPSSPQADNERPELVDVLPISLEHLTLMYADARIIPQLRKVRDVREKQFPNLKKVIVEFCFESTDNIQFEIPGLELIVLYQTKEEREAYIYDRNRFSWVESLVFRD